MEKDCNTFNTAEDLFMERFPHLGILSFSWSSSSMEKETVDEPLPALQLENVEALYVYGLGHGAAYFQIKAWLHEKKERELIFLEDEPGVIASFLRRSEAAVEILSDPQIHIALLSKNKQLDGELQALAERLPERRIEVAALPSYSGRRFQNIRLKLFRKTALSHALHLDRFHGYQTFENFLRNLKHLPGSFYANALKNKFQGIPAIVCGAGPSLKQSMDLLRNLENRALIIAGGSTLAALSSQGISPHFGMAVDPNLEEYRRLKNNFSFEAPLLYSTRVFPSIFQTGNGPFGYMRSGIGGAPELWIEEELGLLDPLLGDFLSPESISVTSICLAWAQFLGCDPILLNGVDLAYTDNKRYADGVAEEGETHFSEIDAEKSVADRIVKRKDRMGKPVYTAVRWVMESASLSHFAKKHPEVRFINTTEGGIGFKGIGYMPLSEAASQFLNREIDLRGLVHLEIAQASMPPNTREKIGEQIALLKESLERVIGHLEILKGIKKGSAALAEMELKEEMAFAYLFYDMNFILDQALNRTFRSWMPHESLGQKEARSQLRAREKWDRLLDQANRYRFLVKKFF